MKKIIKRALDINLPINRSAFLWGPRKSGKTYWINKHYILMELKAYQAYRNPELDIRYWRTSSGFEVDFILGDMNLVIEVKASQKIHRGHTKSLKALKEEYSIGRIVIVSLEKHPRRLDSSIEVLPWQTFLEILWSGGFGV